MATVLENLESARESWAKHLATESAYVAAHGPKPSYSAGGKTVDWPAYFKFVNDLIKALTAQIDELGLADEGPYELHSRVIT